jgi:transcription antitermination factor NusG
MRRANGVRHLVGVCNTPSVVDGWVIEEIRGRIVDGFVKLTEKPVEPFERLDRGQNVRIVEGPFYGHTATFEGVFKSSSDGNHRVIVLLNILNGARTQIDRSAIESMSYAEV